MSAPACRVCRRRLEQGEDAWAEEWKVWDQAAGRFFIAERYVCDNCDREDES